MEHLFSCKDCIRDFVMSDNGVAYLTAKGLSIPKRCPSCRQVRKVAKLAPPALTYSAADATTEVK